MAGGAALNIFRMGNSGLPKAVLNRHLWLAVFTFGLMGAARGVDEGLITGIFNTSVFKESLGLQTLDKDALADVKGNVSGSGRIYHLPGSRHYEATAIDATQGERWFCTPEEAEAAGWRPAR